MVSPDSVHGDKYDIGAAYRGAFDLIVIVLVISPSQEKDKKQEECNARKTYNDRGFPLFESSTDQGEEEVNKEKTENGAKDKKAGTERSCNLEERGKQINPRIELKGSKEPQGYKDREVGNYEVSPFLCPAKKEWEYTECYKGWEKKERALENELKGIEVRFCLQTESKPVEKDDKGNTGSHGETDVALRLFQKMRDALKQEGNYPEDRTGDYPHEGIKQKSPEEHIIQRKQTSCMPCPHLNQAEGQPSYPPDECTLDYKIS